MKKKVIALGLALIMISLSTMSIFAGSGTIDVDNNTIDMKVFFTFQETDKNLEGDGNPSWKTVFEEASKLLWNATNGQLRIGKITVYLRALDQKPKSDVWITKGTKGAYATGLAKMATDNIHFQLYDQTHRSISNSYRGQFSIVHEMGHYVFGLYDQYLGYAVAAEDKDTWTEANLFGKVAGTWKLVSEGGKQYTDSDYIFSISKDSTVASIMDGGGGVAGANERTEFDTAGNTNKGQLQADANAWHMTKQWVKFKESCWETMGKFKWNGTNVFSDVPTGDSPTAIPAGYVAIEFDVVSTLSRLVICVDTSGSMGSEDRMALAKLGANTFVNLLQPKHEFKIFEGTASEETFVVEGDWLGLVSFSDSASTIMGMTEIDKAGAAKTAARAAINGLSAYGSTAIGSGTMQSLNLITGQGDPVSTEAIILLSDGQNNTGTSPATAAASVKARGAKIYAIALGSGADGGTLSSMASTTSGKFYSATDGLGLLAIYPLIYAELKGGGLVNAISSLLGEAESEQHTVEVSSTTDEVTFGITSADNGWSMSITSPSGKVYTGADSASGITYENNSNEIHFNVPNPEQGYWTLNVTSPSSVSSSRRLVNRAGSTFQYNVVTTSDSGNMTISAETDASEYTYPNRALIKCTVINEDPVANATVTAQITAPDGVAIGTISLYDDGLAIHGDEMENDGTYSNYFGTYTQDGFYTADITAVGNDAVAGIAFDGGTDGDERPNDYEPAILPDFNLQTSATFDVSGVPSTDTMWVRMDSMTMTTKDPANSSVKATFTINAPNGTFIPGKQDLALVISNNTFTVPAADFVDNAKKPGVYKIQNKATGVSGSFLANIGGSSRSQAVLTFKGAVLTSIPTSQFFNFQVTFGDDFNQTVSLVGVASVDKKTGAVTKLSYNSKKNYSTTGMLYVDFMQIKTDDNKADKDSLRMVATFSGGSYLPDSQNMTITLGSYIINIPAGTLATQVDKKSGVIKTAKGKLSITNPDGTTAPVNVSVKLQNLNVLTVQASKLDLSGQIESLMNVSVQIGSTFDKATLLTFDSTSKKGKSTYKY